jgi:hypothetical protein
LPEIDFDNLISFKFKDYTYKVIDLCDSQDAYKKHGVALNAGKVYPSQKLVIVNKGNESSASGFFTANDFKSSPNDYTDFVYKPTKIPKSRLDLVTHSDDVMVIQEQDSSTFESGTGSQNLEDPREIEIANLKDLVISKTKTISQQKQAKKDMSKSYNETIKELQQEVEAAIAKIDSLKDEIKVSNLIK